jgi:hypothetical protein
MEFSLLLHYQSTTGQLFYNTYQLSTQAAALALITAAAAAGTIIRMEWRNI